MRLLVGPVGNRYVFELKPFLDFKLQEIGNNLIIESLSQSERLDKCCESELSREDVLSCILSTIMLESLRFITLSSTDYR